MRFKIINNKLNDSIVVEADTIEEVREEANKETKSRGWHEEDCHSEKL